MAISNQGRDIPIKLPTCMFL